MAARRAVPVLVAVAVLAMAAPLAAQAPKAKPTAAQVQSASFYLRVLISALESKEVETPVKNQLFTCLYENSLAKIAEGIDKVAAANPGKVDKTNPTQVLGVMAGLCGYKPAAKAKPVPPVPPAKPGQKPGR
jgi:hypothetical protein